VTECRFSLSLLTTSLYYIVRLLYCEWEGTNRYASVHAHFIIYIGCVERMSIKHTWTCHAIMTIWSIDSLSTLKCALSSLAQLQHNDIEVVQYEYAHVSVDLDLHTMRAKIMLACPSCMACGALHGPTRMPCRKGMQISHGIRPNPNPH
jgi:hypothetical protein